MRNRPSRSLERTTNDYAAIAEKNAHTSAKRHSDHGYSERADCSCECVGRCYHGNHVCSSRVLGLLARLSLFGTVENLLPWHVRTALSPGLLPVRLRHIRTYKRTTNETPISKFVAELQIIEEYSRWHNLPTKPFSWFSPESSF